MKKMEQFIDVYSSENLYELDNQLILNYYPYRIIELIGDTNNQSLLECGLGHGYTSNIFQQFFDRHVILDADEKIIKNFKNKYPMCKSEIVKTYFEDFESDEKFDNVVLGFILEHVDSPVDILKKYKRFKKRDGKMFLTVPNAEALNRRIGYKANMLQDIWQLSDNDRKLGHKRYYSIESIERECKKSGLEIIRVEGLFLKPLTTKQLISLKLSTKVFEALCDVGREYPELCVGLLVEVA